MKMSKKENLKEKYASLRILILEGSLIILIFFLVFFPALFSIKEVFAGIGEPNATVTSELSIGASAPFVTTIDVEQGSVTLTPNATTTVNCSIEIVDYDGDDTFDTVSAEFFDNTASSFGDTDDNNDHYTNNSCFINTTYGDVFTVLATCLFDVWYYGNPGTWNCTTTINDTSNYQVNASNATQIQDLLSVGLPDTINFGTVNATYVSNENITNVTNFGNVMINLSLSGYARTIGDGLAMNCTQGSIATIPIENEKYNLTDSHAGSLTLGQTVNYTNLSAAVVTRRYNLDYRTNDTDNLAFNQTYWRIYVPLGVGGTCNGSIVFGATQAPGS